MRRISVFFIALVSVSALAIGQDAIETLDQQEQEIPSMPRVQGPITIIRPGALVFASFDRDGDYLISQDEAKAGATETFARADRDKNGQVSLFELEDWRVAALGSLDALPGNLSFDSDYNNQVSPSEFDTAFMKLFERHDADQSGSLKHAELMQILDVPRRKEPTQERQTDRQCAEQIQRNRSRF